MMKKISLVIASMVLCLTTTIAQNVGINTNGATPNTSAILDLTGGSTAGSMGFLPPQVTLQSTTDAATIASPATGLLVYNSAAHGAGTATAVFIGYYYNSGTPGSPVWVRINDNAYGQNVQCVTGTSDISTNSNSFAAMNQMTITFTPIHSTVYVSFSASGATDLSRSHPQYVECELLKGTTVLQGCVSQCQDDDGGGESGAWNVAMMLPVSVTPGTSVTISVNWMTDGPESLSSAQNNVNSFPQYSHRTLFIND